MEFNFYLIIPIIGITFGIGLLALLITQGRNHVARKPFASFLVFMTLWIAFIFLMRLTPDLGQAAFWESFVFASIISAAFSLYWFAARFTNTRISWKNVVLVTVPYGLAMVAIPTGLIFTGMQLMWYGKAPIVGPLFPLYTIGVYLPIALGLRHLMKYYSATRSNDEKIRLQYIISGIFVLFIGGTTDYLPALGVGMYPLGIIGTILFSILTTIAMLKYGLLEIKMVLRKGLVYSLVSIFVFGIFGSVILILSTVFQSVVSPISMVITITAVFFIAAIFQPGMTRLQSIVDRWFFRQRYDHLQALKKFAKDTDGDLDIDDMSTSLVTIVANAMQSGGVYLLLPTPISKDFVTKATSSNHNLISIDANSPLVVTLKYHEGILDSNDMDIIPSLSSLPDKDRNMLKNNNIDLTIPLKNEGHLIGILMLSGKNAKDSYSNEDRKLLQSTMESISIRIANASRFEKIQQANVELEKAMDGIIYSVSAVIESRDPYTAGHQRRVAELARAIAAEMGLPEWQIRGIYITGLLHDVGKIGVPAEILSKPGKISSFEFNIIKNHSRTGYEILEKVEFPWPVAKAILQHHERIDGSGYPEGLKGSEILLEAKILGVADVVEAMSSHRPYRPALGLEPALQEISQKRGIIFDCEVVDACLKLLRNNQFVFDELMTAAENSQEIIKVGKN